MPVAGSGGMRKSKKPFKPALPAMGVLSRKYLIQTWEEFSVPISVSKVNLLREYGLSMPLIRGFVKCRPAGGAGAAAAGPKEL
jgi:hypothetical protein